ncbi:Similar to Catalase B; acc. no. Q877A8 [Pyronema omphalodes CBS 100304]|uniref:Catalase n=1 Tax=Pyronema omphalodes (strain CBS 100304) TaxID=1076935 RepID=U4LAD0_PYROM|nr:Similar to Catalase B; acc. no. Q877A8 [Pyronema omphalodes CBS 100304]
MRGTILSGIVLNALLASAACPFMQAGGENPHEKRDKVTGDDGFLDQFVVNDANTYTTTDFGRGRGPTLLEDFVMRTKITRFDHERIPERAVHARGAAAHGYFESYGDWSNITAASFLNTAGKQTPIFLRFSTVAGSRGSADTARDVHGFSLRFYTDQGNYDIVGNNIPVFFIQDAIQFPDLIHAVKPRPDNEIPQAATAHDSAWDFFSSNPSTMHTLMWALSGHGIPRSFRHIDGFGVHTFRFVTDEGKSKLIKWHFKSKQGRASVTWPEAQALAGKNADYHRQDLHDAIENGHFPEWEVGVQIMEESDVLRFGYDLLDPTKIVPVEDVPITPIGKFILNRNTMNYFAETEQSMFCPGHIVRGIDFSEDPLLQGRLFSYVDTQLNRNMGSPNFEQIPINRPRVTVHNNNRDGAGQQMLHSNISPYSENTLNEGAPYAANMTHGQGFFTAPERRVNGAYIREKSPTFMDFWSQPRLFLNSLSPAELQMVINAARFELSNVKSKNVQKRVIAQFNRISNELATRVAKALGLEAPAPETKYYHNNKTSDVSTFGNPLSSIATLNVGILASTSSAKSVAQAQEIAAALKAKGANPTVIAEHLADGVGATYSGADAVLFDGIIIADDTRKVFTSQSSLYPVGRPVQIVRDAFYYGKPVAAVGAGKAGFSQAAVDEKVKGVYTADAWANIEAEFETGLKQFKFLDRFPIDE